MKVAAFLTQPSLLTELMLRAVAVGTCVQVAARAWVFDLVFKHTVTILIVPLEILVYSYVHIIPSLGDSFS